MNWTSQGEVSNRNSSDETAKMQLKIQWPNATRRRARLSANLNSLATLALFVSLYHVEGRHHQEPISANEISQQLPTNFSRFPRDVTNLRMTPDLRSMRLQWNYVQPNVDSARPLAFEVRYCELTSWMAEIKCRHRNVPVAGEEHAATTANDFIRQANLSSNVNSTVIHPDDNHLRQHHLDAVARLVPGDPAPEAAIGMISSAYETYVYDLRALTNYTFSVQVARFAGEPGNSLTPTSTSVKTDSLTRASPRPARRLDLAKSDQNELTSAWSTKDGKLFRAETKSFQAEALKCLANSSEVLINTGRYFGGRISVESQPFDPRCQLVGNKSSVQASYLLRIDHEICHSKVIDSNRIETMILVHENKDILTHNTARFLVQCNIMQKSFTVKASVSLPKINSLNQQQASSQARSGPGVAFRPATITLLPGRPGAPFSSSPDQPAADEQQVRLGSMPGVYRLSRGGGGLSPFNQLEAEPARAEASESVPLRVAAPEGQVVGASGSPRRPKELQPLGTRSPRDNGHVTGDNYQLELPSPVEVSSKILFVTRANNDHLQSAARQRSAPLETSLSRFVSVATSNPLEVVVAPRNASQSLDANHKSPQQQRQQQQQQQSAVPNERGRPAVVEANMRQMSDDAKASELLTQPIVMTNNHRVTGNFLPLAQLASDPLKTSAATSANATDPSDFSMRYSTTKVDEYAFNDNETGRSPVLDQRPATVPTQSRSRSGRMRQIVRTPPSSIADQNVGRVGDTPDQADLAGSASATDQVWAQARDEQTNSTGATLGPTLAQNITGALIRWSLKTLGNLARKSLESLVEERDALGVNQTREGDVARTQREERMRDGFLVDDGSIRRSAVRVQPPLTTSANGLQQANKAATQSSDLVQSRVPHHLEPPPSLTLDARKSSARQLPTTVALGQSVTSSSVPSATTPTTTTTTSTTTTKLPALQQHHRQQKSTKDTHSQLEPQQHSARIRSHLAAENKQAPTQLDADQSRESATGSSLSYSPIILLWTLAGFVIVFMIVVYFVAFSVSSSPQIFKPAPMPNCQGGTSHQHQPRLGFLAQLNDAIYRHHHTTPPNHQPSLGGLVPKEFSPQSVKSVGQLSPGSDVRSPSMQRRRAGNGADLFVGSPIQPLSNPAGSEFGSNTTRSTSAASTSNLSARTGGSSFDEDQQENYCKNHEQFVYSDYLLLNKSDCLSNECGRESFA